MPCTNCTGCSRCTELMQPGASRSVFVKHVPAARARQIHRDAAGSRYDVCTALRLSRYSQRIKPAGKHSVAPLRLTHLAPHIHVGCVHELIQPLINCCVRCWCPHKGGTAPGSHMHMRWSTESLRLRRRRGAGRRCCRRAWLQRWVTEGIGVLPVCRPRRRRRPRVWIWRPPAAAPIVSSQPAGAGLLWISMRPSCGLAAQMAFC